MYIGTLTSIEKPSKEHGEAGVGDEIFFGDSLAIGFPKAFVFWVPVLQNLTARCELLRHKKLLLENDIPSQIILLLEHLVR